MMPKLHDCVKRAPPATTVAKSNDFGSVQAMTESAAAIAHGTLTDLSR